VRDRVDGRATLHRARVVGHGHGQARREAVGTFGRSLGLGGRGGERGGAGRGVPGRSLRGVRRSGRGLDGAGGPIDGRGRGRVGRLCPTCGREATPLLELLRRRPPGCAPVGRIALPARNGAKPHPGPLALVMRRRHLGR
jgi:hypothetical protein